MKSEVSSSEWVNCDCGTWVVRVTGKNRAACECTSLSMLNVGWRVLTASARGWISGCVCVTYTHGADMCRSANLEITHGTTLSSDVCESCSWLEGILGFGGRKYMQCTLIDLSWCFWSHGFVFFVVETRWKYLLLQFFLLLIFRFKPSLSLLLVKGNMEA